MILNLSAHFSLVVVHMKGEHKSYKYLWQRGFLLKVFQHWFYHKKFKIHSLQTTNHLPHCLTILPVFRSDIRSPDAGGRADAREANTKAH